MQVELIKYQPERNHFREAKTGTLVKPDGCFVVEIGEQCQPQTAVLLGKVNGFL